MAVAPGGVARFWTMGPDVSSTTMFATVDVPHFAQGGVRARRAHIERFVETHTATSTRSSRSWRGTTSVARRSWRRSRGSPSRPHLADFRERSSCSPTLGEVSSLGGDWECSHIPSAQALAPRLRRAQVLVRSSLNGVRIVF